MMIFGDFRKVSEEEEDDDAAATGCDVSDVL